MVGAGSSSGMVTEMVMVLGYFVFEWALYGGAAALGAVVPNLVQGAFGVILGMILTEISFRLFANKKQ